MKHLRIPCAILILATVAVACGEWDKYWDEDLAGPTGPADAVAPDISILAPTSTDSLLPTPANGSYSIRLGVRDNVALREVDLYIDGDSVAAFTREPFVHSWNTIALEEGSLHPIWARAVDSSENTAVSDTVYAVIFNAEPAVELTNPGEGALVSGEVTLTAQSGDLRRPLARIDFMADGHVIGSAAAAPYQILWDSHGVSAGSHFLAAKAIDAKGQTGVSPFVTVSVNNTAPSVELLFPEDGREVAVRGTVPFLATAEDILAGDIGSSVVWSSDLDGEIGSGAELEYRELSMGLHTITATGTNAWGLTGRDSVQLLVREPTYSYCFDIYFNILLPMCRACHNPTDFPEYWVQNEFDMSTYPTLMAGGRSQRDLGLRAISPCKPDESLLWDKATAWSRGVNPTVGNPMPPPGSLWPLTADQLDQIRIWIEEGAPPDAEYEEECP